uniref:fukutin-like n=1 Tax=Ciona intestinalis TaxID=7719 RepID=UPI000EF51F5B|nr:fukutin-like [Ciona intestinalis]|eukprot:XP_018669848.2 fukutin-like [Ciona intestinalis]
MGKDSQHLVSLKLLQSNSKATLMTFGVLGSEFMAQKEATMKEIEEIFLLNYISLVQDRRENIPIQIPGHLWIVDNHHIIHIMMSHKRGNGYLWIAPISNIEWGKIIEVLNPFVEGGILGFGAKIRRYAQAVDSNVFETALTLPFYDSKLFIPFETTSFLEDLKSSEFIECNHMRADNFKQKYEQNITEKDVKYILTSKRILTTASKVFNELKIPFTLSSGNLLGWFRQCDVIPYAKDVDIEVKITDFSMKLIENLILHKFILHHKSGRLLDSLVLAFYRDGVKLDLYFVYEEIDKFWSGFTGANGAKYKLSQPKYSNCWGDLLGLKVRVPCDTLTYITTQYGSEWAVPIKNYHWITSPRNIVENGKWDGTAFNPVIFDPINSTNQIAVFNILKKEVEEML